MTNSTSNGKFTPSKAAPGSTPIGPRDAALHAALQAAKARIAARDRGDPKIAWEPNPGIDWEPDPDMLHDIMRERRLAREIEERQAAMLAARLDYAMRGWDSFPARIEGKIKKSYKSAEYSNGAAWGKTRDPERIRRDFQRWSEANIGIPTGADNKIWVLETDTPEGHAVDGDAALAALEQQHGALPDTLMAISPSGSKHRYFNHPGNGIKVISRGLPGYPGVDIKGDGGMVIAPPSTRADGSYRWLNDLPIANAPPWLIALVTSRGKGKGNGKDHEPVKPKIEIDPEFKDFPFAPMDDNSAEYWFDGLPPEQKDEVVDYALAVITSKTTLFEIQEDGGDNNQWYRLVTSVARSGAPNAEDIFVKYAKLAKNADPEDALREKFRVCQKNPRGITVGTLLWLARDHGADFGRWRQEGQPSGPPRLPSELRNMLHLVGDQPVGDYKTRKHLLWAFINTARRKGIDENEIVDACLDEKYGGCAIHEHVRDNGGKDYIKGQIERAINSDPLIDEQQRSIIRLEDGKLDEHWRAVQRELINRGCPVYVRGNRLVQPLWRWEKADGHEVLTARFERYNVPRLADMVAHHACKFQKFDARKKGWKDIDPPDRLIEHVIEAQNWEFLTIVGIINAPTMRADGSLLTTEGYDPATQLWFKSSGDVTLPPIPDNPDKEDAQKALALLDGLLEEFPFDNAVARSAALAGIMTPVLRGTLSGAVPLFAIIATEPRSGKTYLVNLIAMIATGHVPIPTAGSEKCEEMEKRIETAALQGRPILHLNNLPNGMVVESEALAQLSTEGVIFIRKLGRHEEGLCDCRATTAFLNGNNIVIAEDLVPRTVSCQLNARLERPESRMFAGDPISRVRADRGRYLGAVLTIVRAFMAAGCPRQPHKVVAGFEQWSRLVQQSLIWLGEQDPFGGMDELRALDPKHEELDTLLDTLKKHFPAAAPFTVAECQQKAEATLPGGYGQRWEFTSPDLRAVMLDDHGQTVLAVLKYQSSRIWQYDILYTFAVWKPPIPRNRKPRDRSFSRRSFRWRPAPQPHGDPETNQP